MFIMGPTYSCEKCCFCLHDYNSLQYRPNWHALPVVKSCINVNHCPVSVTSLEICVVYEVYEILK